MLWRSNGVQPGKTTGAELRLPTGEPVFQDNDIWTVDAELSDGPDKLVKLTRWDSYDPPVASTMFYDLNSKSLIKFGDSDRISGGDLIAILLDGKLFVDGRSSNNSQFGFGVWNLGTKQWDLLKNRDEATKMAIAKLTFFDDRLYVTYSNGTLSVIALPAANQVASSWLFGRSGGEPAGRWCAVAKRRRPRVATASKSCWCKTRTATTPAPGPEPPRSLTP